MDYSLREMTIDDLPAVIALWNTTEGILPDDADDEERLARYLSRNPGLCLVAERDGKIIAAVKCGQDGRRGYLHHLAVKESCRRQGIGRALVDAVLRALKNQGIEKCNTFVLDGNQAGRDFWEHNDWRVLEYYYRTLQKDTAVEECHPPKTGQMK
jgi:N-acetylglutamate synthase